jgi:hypothetical protein
LLDVNADDDVPMLEMTQAEYARHRGVTRQAIRDLVKKGKIELIEHDGRKVIDVVAADRALGETRERVSVRDDDEPARPAEAAGLTKAKTATEVYRARLAQLEYEERVGNLMPVAEVKEGATLMGHSFLRVLEMALLRADELRAAARNDNPAEHRQALRKLIYDQRLRAVEAMNEMVAAAAAKQPSADT